ncbi:hypothetical protein OV203_05560 [Nannocystis sp. ILAH1]|uniref:hypothetical protein n=1 Tax=Nannocystis sp. ILAH1 TaxID=2996789 RepID=UPI00226FE87E|nr:hypothetical protein [Nannocystis sp. ILAH1]MCY0986575.1 hypothetical protein [Nannocystis sp. ILAH1]
MRRSAVAWVVGAGVFAVTGQALAVDESLDVRVRYSILDEQGEPLRTLDDGERERFVNRARCECGVPIQAELQADGGVGTAARTILGFVGNRCAGREAAEGRNGLCSVLLAEPAAVFREGFSALFHPAFLNSYVASTQREVGSPYTTLARGCEGEGQGGVWLCDPQADGAEGCQEDEFVYDAEVAGEPLRYDFEPPYELPYDLRAEPRAGGVLLSWSSPGSQDIAGFRVVCETEWQYPPELSFPAPARDEAADGTSYYTVDSVCGGEPHSLVKVAEDGLGICGDGHVDPGEECDEGDQNSDEGLCSDSCELCVSPQMQRLDWSRVCSDFIAPDQTSVFITGLDPDQFYHFALVAHDAAGNARALGQLASEAPYVAWDADVGDDAGMFGCSVGPKGHGSWVMSMGLCSLLGWIGRRRRR